MVDVSVPGVMKRLQLKLLDGLFVWGPAVAMMVVIFIISSTSNPPPTTSIGIPDVGAHAVAYCVLGMFVLRGFAVAQWDGVTKVTALVAFVLTVGYGISDEWHQSFVPGRTSEVRDIVADAIGAAIGVGGVLVWGIVLDKRNKKCRK